MVSWARCETCFLFNSWINDYGIEEVIKHFGLEEKAEEIENSAEIIREAADIKQNLNQTGTWKTTDEIITTKIIAPDGSIFSEEIFNVIIGTIKIRFNTQV